MKEHVPKGRPEAVSDIEQLVAWLGDMSDADRNKVLGVVIGVRLMHETRIDTHAS